MLQKRIIQNKLLISGFSVMLILIAIMGYMAVREAKILGKSTDDIYTHPFTVSNAVREIHIHINSIQRYMKDVVLANNDEELEFAISKVDMDEIEVYKHFDVVMERFLGDKTQIIQARKTFADWRSIRAEVIELMRQGNKDQAAAITKGKGVKHIDLLLSQIHELVDFANKKANEFYDASSSKIKQALFALYSLCAFILIIGLIISIHVIIKINASTKKLSRSEERFDLAVKGSNDGLWDRDIENDKETWCSPRYSELLGYEEDEMAMSHKAFLDRLHPEDKDNVLNATRAHFEQRTPFDMEYRLQTKSEEYRWFRGRGQAVWDEQGNPVRMAGSIQDITERKLTEETLREEKQLLNAIIAVPTDMIYAKDIDGHFILANPTLANYFGIPAEAIIGKTNAELFPTKGRAAQSDLEDKEVISTGKSFSFERTEIIKDHTRSRMSTKSPYKNAEGEIIGIIGISRDITGRKNIEQQLFQAQKMEAVGQLTGGIAHDFNNILAAVLGYSNLALERCTNTGDVKLLDYLKEIIHSGERARDMIEQMLAYSQTLPSEASKQSLQPLIEKALKLLRPSLPSSIDIQLQPAEELPEVKIDPTQFEQIIMNLCINARDAMEGKGLIEIVLSSSSCDGEVCSSCYETIMGQFVTLVVKDSGAGIPDHIKAQIFEPFYTTKEVGKGSGMGLAMVHGIMHAYGGHIQVTSTHGEGTTFYLMFPLISNDVAESDNTDIAKHHVALDDGQQRGVIMVVDDELSVANYLGEMLGNRGYDVVLSTNSEDALNTIREVPAEVDLVITDQTMPGITGLELSQEILSLRSDMPIIMITGYSEQVDDAIAKDKGIKAYLTKPIDEALLLEKIYELMPDSGLKAHS